MARCAIVAIGVLLLPCGALAQNAAQTIENALAAAPERAREGAAVIKWNADQTYETLQAGTNQLVCYDRSGEPGRQPFAVQCTNVANLERVAQNRRFEAESGGDRDKMSALLEAAEANGTRVLPEYGSVWYAMNGPDRANARIHTTIAVPGATTESTGLPGSGRGGGAWLMNAGTSTAHIMIPGR